MSESPIGEQLSRAFKPHLRSTNELYDVRVQIAAYVGSLQPQSSAEEWSPESVAIPSHVTGIRRQYLKAIQENLVAQQEYARLKNQIRCQSQSQDELTGSHEILKVHMDVLKLRKQHHKYQTLLRYMSELEALTERDRVYNIQPVNERLAPVSTGPATADHSALLAQAQELTRSLEVAILQANHQLKHERQLLDELKSSKSVPDDPSPVAKLRALAATQTELNTWVEASLAKCDSAGETNIDETRGAGANARQKTIDHEQMINEQYQKYLEARRELLEAASDLRIPLSTSELTDNDPKQQLAQKTDPKQAKLNPQLKELSSIFPYLDSKHLPLVEQHESLHQACSHIAGVLSKHNRDLSERLLRLSEESHLLPSYPILAKASKSDHESGSTERLLHAWKFAMNAADTAMAATAEKQIRVGEKAVEAVENVLDGQNEANDLWKKLQTS